MTYFFLQFCFKRKLVVKDFYETLLSKKFILILFVFFSFNSFSQCSADAGLDTTKCAEQNVSIGGLIAGSGNGTLTYAWSPSVGLSCSNCPNPICSATVNTTYTLTVTDGDGCVSIDQVNVFIAADPNASFSSSPTGICSNFPVLFSPNFSSGIQSYQWNFGDPSSGGTNASSQQSPSHIFETFGSGSTTYSVQLIATNAAGCKDTVIQNITVLQTPGAELIDPTNNFQNCTGSNFNMTIYNATAGSANLYTIIWGDGTANYSSSTFPSGGLTHLYNTADIFDLNYIVNGTNGCSDTANYVIANITNPSIGVANPGGTIGCGPTTICFPLSSYFNNHISTIYVVNFGDGTSPVTYTHPPPSEICHTYSSTSCGQPGNAFTLSIKASNFCDSSFSSVNPIKVYVGPQANFTVPANKCLNSSVLFTNTSILGYNAACSRFTTFTWNFGDGSPLLIVNSAVLTNPSHTYTSVGTYTVTLTTSNTCSTSTHTATVCIEVPPVPNFTLGNSMNCVPFVATVTNTSTSLNTCSVTNTWSVLFNGSTCLPSTGSWNFTGGTTSSSNQPAIQFVSPGTYTVKLTMVNSCGSYFVNQNTTGQAAPKITLNPLTSICAGTSVSPTAVVINCYESVDTYNWTLTGGTPSLSTLAAPGSVIYPTAGSYSVLLQATNGCGTTSASTPLTVTAPPIANAGNNVQFCSGGNSPIGSASVAGVTYSWSPATGLSSATAANPTLTLNNLTSSPIIYSYIVTATTTPGCFSKDTVLVTVNPNPVLTVNSPTICFGQTASLLVDGAGVGGTYNWNISPSLSCLNCPNPDAAPASTATYTVIGTNTYGCTATTTSTVTVNDLPITYAGIDDTICLGSSVTITASGASTYSWSPSTYLNTTIGNSVISTPLANIQYVVEGTAVNGCIKTDTINIIVEQPATVNANVDQTICAGSNVVLDGSIGGSATNSTWTASSGTFSNATSLTSTYTPSITSGTVTLTLTTNDPSGPCAAVNDQVLITVNPQPSISSNDATICIGQSATLNAAGAGVGGAYNWMASPTLSCTNCQSATATPLSTTTYTVSGTNSLGCSNTGTALVTVNPLPIVSAGADVTLCDQPITYTFIGSPSGGIWSGSLNIISSGVFTPNGAETSNLLYVYTNPLTGCENSDTALVTVTPAPIPTAIPTYSICVNNAAVNLNTVLSSSPSGGIWSGTGVTNPTFTPSIAGVGTHTVTYSIGAGTCLTTVTSAITVNPQPTISANNATICFGQSATLNATGAGVGGSYNWTASPSLSCTACQTTIATPTTATTYTVAGTTSFGCSNSATPLVTVNPLPIVNAGVDTTLCNQPIPVQMIGTIIGGTWSGPSINPTGLFTPSGTGTYSVTYTVVLATGCTNSDVKIITVISPTLSNAGIDQTICVGNPSIAITGSPAGGSWSGPGITPLGVFTPSSSGVFGLIYSIGFGNCLTRDTMNFTVNALPIISAGPDRQFCISDNSDSFIGNPSGGTWSGTGITNNVSGTFDPALAGAGVHPIVYTYSDPLTSCLNRDTLLSTVHPLPSVSFSYNPIICQGVAETFTNTSTFVASSQWDFGDGATSSSFSETHIYSTPGFYDIQLIVTSPFGCIDSLTQSVEVRSAPFSEFSIAIDSACGPVVTTFNNVSSGSGLSYNWQLGNGQTSSSFNPGTQSYGAASGIDTTYYVQLSVTNNCGSSTYLDSIIVMPQPIAFFGTNVNSGCSPLALSIANLSSGLPDSYFWDFGNGITSTSSANLIQETFVTGSTPTVYTISLVVQNECGLDSTSHIITVLPNTVTAFFNSSITSGCENLTVDFTQYSIGGTIYNWDFGDNNTSTQLNPTHTFMNPGNYDVSLVINDGCAFDTMVTTIVVNPAPLVGFSVAPDSVCINEPFNFTNSSLNLANSSWTFGDGGASGLTNPQHAYSQPGNYSVTLVGTSLANGCVDSVMQVVHVSQNTLSSFTVNASSGCAPFNVQFTNLSSNAAYQSWNFGDGNSSTSINPNHIFTAAGTYQVQLITESASGCSDTSVVVITAHPLPVSDFSFVSTNTCYLPVDVIITNNSTGAFNYYWDFGNGQTSSTTNTSVTYTNPGTYIISLVAENMYGCQSENQQTIIVYPTPVAQFQLMETVACANDPLVFQSNNINVDEVLWIMGDGSELMGDTVTYAYTIPGNYYVTMIVYGAGGCGDTLISNTSLTINPDPVANFEYVNVQVPDPLNGTVEFTNLSQGASNYVWFFSNDSTSTAIDPVFQFRNYGTYNTTLVAINEFGCTDTIAMDVVVDFFNGLFLPNAIYPGSGIFEISHFIPKGVGLKEYELQIYDDWGNLIWQTTALDLNGRPSEFWDGTFNGVPVQQDAYVWKVKAVFLDNAIWEGNDMKTNKIKRSGTVTVIR